MLTHPDTLPCIRIKTTDLKGTLLGFAADVSDGMAHLEEVGCVHRDLATRNVLLTEQLVVSNMQYKHHAVRGVQYSTMQYNAVQSLLHGVLTGIVAACTAWSCQPCCMLTS